MTQAVIIQMLEDSAEHLRRDLSMLEHQMVQNRQGMLIAYDADEPCLVVYAAAKYKAYVPKRYNGWDVRFSVWDGKELELDLDISISMD